MKTKQFLLIVLACFCIPFAQLWSNPVNGLLERIDPGASNLSSTYKCNFLGADNKQ